MMLSGHQPVYLPGIILFNKIALSDAFMFVGHCQLVRKSWHTRNRIRLGETEHWLSVPVNQSGRFGQSINDASILDGVWRRKHIGSLRQAYQRRPYFDTYFLELAQLIEHGPDRLGEFNIALIQCLLDWLEIRRPIFNSQDYDITGHKTDMLISMCRAVGASAYLSNSGSTYVNETAMTEAGINHYWQAFIHPVYEQGGAFMPDMSVIDLLFNIGPAAGESVRSCGWIVTNRLEVQLKETG